MKVHADQAASAASGQETSTAPPEPERWPQGKRFAFSIIDDTDVATVANVRPIYRLLEQLGLRATKTVWPVSCPEGSRHFAGSQTLDDPDYLDFVQDLQRRGFEIAFHGATMESSTRERTCRALERFKECFGSYPRVHANHGCNRENIYWGRSRIDQPLIKWIYGRAIGVPDGYYAGHIPGSAYWWRDLCQSRIEYVRNLTFNSLDLSRINPGMPYADRTRPLVRRWFSAADAESADEFVRLLDSRNQKALEANQGFAIVATHFGKNFVVDGQVDPRVQELLEELSSRNGWFCTVSELLDWLRARQASPELSEREWRRIQRIWLLNLLSRRLTAKWTKLRQRLPIAASPLPSTR